MLLTDDEAQEIFHSKRCTISKELSGILYRAIEAEILEKLASAELPEPAMRTHGAIDTTEKHWFTADQLRQAFAQGAASQLSAEPVVFLAPSGHVYGMKVAAGTNSKPLFTLKEPK